VPFFIFVSAHVVIVGFEMVYVPWLLVGPADMMSGNAVVIRWCVLGRRVGINLSSGVLLN